ncbi:hypothetical protein ACIRYZ_43065 [Kitasatospora sp. NPDC101155]|uniref:hypothetical protein n=1 Tax=Kitasatospora sp. NPDC101155 TaxID=3364097 RepID=UPI0038006DCB
MTAPDSLPFAALLEENLASASPDLLHALVKAFAEAMMSADVDRACGGEYGRALGRIGHGAGRVRPPPPWRRRSGRRWSRLAFSSFCSGVSRFAPGRSRLPAGFQDQGDRRQALPSGRR